MNQRKASARYYLFEDLVWTTPGFAPLRQRRSIHDLQLLAGLVWARERGRGKCPLVRPKTRNDTSYFLEGTIHLVPKHRNAGALLHEMAHALGSRDKLDHGPAFRNRCIRLYKTYGDWSGEIDWQPTRKRK